MALKADKSLKMGADGVLRDARPIRAVVGWIEGVGIKDAIAYAKGFIEKRFEARDRSFYAVAPFMGGFLYEVHEGGSGLGYLPGVVDALTRNPDAKVWFPCDNRVYQVLVRDGKPLGMLLPEEDSRKFRESAPVPLEPSAKMKPAVRSGAATCIVGASILAVGALFLASACAFYLFIDTTIQTPRSVTLANLPHHQWQRVSKPASSGDYAESLSYSVTGAGSAGGWDVKWKRASQDSSKNSAPPETSPEAQRAQPGAGAADVAPAASAGSPPPPAAADVPKPTPVPAPAPTPAPAPAKNEAWKEPNKP
jgi:hypothetical protein